MANILYRASTSPTTPISTTAKNAPLTNLEVDGNFKSLNDQKLELTGDDRVVSTNTADTVVRRNSSGNFAANVITVVDLNSTSDSQLKININTITGAVDVLNQLNGVEFDWIEDGRHSSGVVAQELERVIPFLVVTDDNGTKSVNYNGLIAYLIQANKELAARVSTLESK